MEFVADREMVLGVECLSHAVWGPLISNYLRVAHVTLAVVALSVLSRLDYRFSTRHARVGHLRWVQSPEQVVTPTVRSSRFP